MRWERWIGVGGVGLVALVWAACAALGPGEDEAASPFLNVVDGVAFVGDAACASCHEELVVRYQSHGMARSFYHMTSERAVEDFSGIVVTHEGTGFFYTAYREGDRFVQEEYRLDPRGQKTHRLVYAMDYVVGSGSAARTYLTEESGRLYELPLTWYTQAERERGRWDLSPGYREANGRFSRAIPPRCMACHNGTSEPVPFADGKYARLAEGIGCEQCHGPGALHVEARLASSEAADSVDYTIVNPRHLALDRRLDVCQQCHLTGEVSLLREGERAFGYRPSEPLSAHVALFQLASDDPRRVGVISHADRMKQSPCFVESGAMDCTTCHDPHEGFREAGPMYFNRTCIGCHDTNELQPAMPTARLRQQHAPQANCFSCHMPKVEADDAPHSSFTDHFIRVVREDDQIRGTASAGSAAELRPYFERDERGDEAQTYEGMAYVAYGRQNGDRRALERGVGLLAEALQKTPALGEAQYLLGFARMQLGRTAEAVAALEEAVQLGPNVPERLNALAQAYEQAGRDPSKAEALYRRALAVQPEAADVRVNLGRSLEARGRLEGATVEYRRAAASEPSLAAAHYNLGTALLRQGQQAEGERALRQTVRLEPDHADALTNLAVVLAQRGAVAEAGPLFQRAVSADPRNANAQANLALYRLNTGDAAAARRHAEEALALNPQQPTAQQVLALLAGAR